MEKITLPQNLKGITGMYYDMAIECVKTMKKISKNEITAEQWAEYKKNLEGAISLLNSSARSIEKHINENATEIPDNNLN